MGQGLAVSIRDVAQLAGVSVGTVSNAINRPDEVSAETLARVRGAIDKLRYVPNRSARTLRGGIGSSVGFVVNDGQNPFFADIVRGAEDEAMQHGIVVLLGNTDEDPEREKQYLDLFEAQQVLGVLLTPSSGISPRVRQLASRGIRSVLIDAYSRDAGFSSISLDNVAAGREAVEHLVAQGRRKIAVVGPHATPQVAERLAGAKLAAASLDLPVEIREIPTPGMSVADGVVSGNTLLAKNRSAWPDAIFATNDLIALGILQALVTDGRVRVPDEIAIMGFDDIAFAGAAAVPLSSMRQPGRAMGRTAMRVLLEETRDRDIVPRQTVFQAELVVRASTATR
ncbi:LacI family DNA-binding transcriptional regulator [Microbacterium forte]